MRGVTAWYPAGGPPIPDISPVSHRPHPITPVRCVSNPQRLEGRQFVDDLDGKDGVQLAAEDEYGASGCGQGRPQFPRLGLTYEEVAHHIEVREGASELLRLG
jgi:hypothetical protein